MICPNCNNKTFKNTALGKEFNYCKNCKIEVEEKQNVYCKSCGDILTYYSREIYPICDKCIDMKDDIDFDAIED